MFSVANKPLFVISFSFVVFEIGEIGGQAGKPVLPLLSIINVQLPIVDSEDRLESPFYLCCQL